LSSGGLAVKTPGAKGYGSQHRGWMITLNGAAISTELLKIKGHVKDPLKTLKHSGSDHPHGISAPSFHTAPL